ncbi:MAG: four helix bundle protein [Bacteroidetes bacterium]|nr:MAG: four helix bundle protein [Bacteroidota bacterium]
MAYTFYFEKLGVWHLAKDIAKYVYKLTEAFPDSEKYGLQSQMRRAAVSIASNIAEGTSRKSYRYQAHFTQLAYSSLMEVFNQFLLAKELGFLSNASEEEFRRKVEELANKLNSLRNSQLNRVSEPETPYGILSNPQILNSSDPQTLQMVDLASQYQRLKPEIDEAIQRVLESSRYIKGPEVEAFEEELAEYTGVNHVIGCANGTDALQIALMALGLKPGDEVIVPAFTYVATAEVIGLLGLVPVMVDVDPHTFNVRAEDIEPYISEKTKAIVPVHLFGQSCDMAPILALAEKHGLYVIEDNAQAIGAKYTFPDGSVEHTGTMGHIGTTSFFPSKNLGCYGDGGAIMCNDDNLAEKIRMIANHGQKKTYYHDLIGVNSRLDALQAAILRVKLRHLDEFNAARQWAAEQYDQYFSKIEGLEIPARLPHSTHVFHQYTLRVKNGQRDALKAHLQESGIPCNIYYPLPLYRQKAFENWWRGKPLPATETLCEEVISLPMHTEMDPTMLENISGFVERGLEKLREV